MPFFLLKKRRKSEISDILDVWNSPGNGKKDKASTAAAAVNINDPEQLYNLHERKAAVLDVTLRARQNFDAAKTVINQVERMQSMLRELNAQLERKVQSQSPTRVSYTDEVTFLPPPQYPPHKRTAVMNR